MTRGGRRDGAGRPALYDENLKPVTVWLTSEQIEWSRKRGDVSETIRATIEEAMMKPKQAIQKLATSGQFDEGYGDAARVLTAAVMGTLDNMGIAYDSDSLQDWIFAGNYIGNETVESIAQEFGELSNQ